MSIRFSRSIHCSGGTVSNSVESKTFFRAFEELFPGQRHGQGLCCLVDASSVRTSGALRGDPGRAPLRLDGHVFWVGTCSPPSENRLVPAARIRSEGSCSGWRCSFSDGATGDAYPHPTRSSACFPLLLQYEHNTPESADLLGTAANVLYVPSYLVIPCLSIFHDHSENGRHRLI